MVIYRKYRPKAFSEMTGQEHIVQSLQNAIRRNRVGHAYLFTGPRGTGKTTLARIFSKAINCQTTVGGSTSNSYAAASNGFAEPCNSCTNCADVNAGRSLDLIEIDAASHRGIDEVRELREGIKFAPAKARYKIFVIDEAHQLTGPAFNALLKTLEEPPAHAIFILATTEPEKMLPTILSRVVRFDFRRLKKNEILERLTRIVSQEGMDLPQEAYQLIVEEAEGSLRDAESLLEKVLQIGEDVSLEAVERALGAVSFAKISELASALFEKDPRRAIEILHRLVEEGGGEPRVVLNGLVRYFRRTLLLNAAPELKQAFASELSEHQLAGMLQYAAAQPKHFSMKAIERLLWAEQAMRWAPYPIIPVEMVVIEIASGQ